VIDDHASAFHFGEVERLLVARSDIEPAFIHETLCINAAIPADFIDTPLDLVVRVVAVPVEHAHPLLRRDAEQIAAGSQREHLVFPRLRRNGTRRHVGSIPIRPSM
jgi:hypothetical protein